MKTSVQFNQYNYAPTAEQTVPKNLRHLDGDGGKDVFFDLVGCRLDQLGSDTCGEVLANLSQSLFG
jgi:hypothetical protein